MTTTARTPGYVFVHAGRAFDPSGTVEAMTRPEADAHNAALSMAEVAWIRQRLPERHVGYLAAPSTADGHPVIRTWQGDTFATTTTARMGRRWNGFGSRWDRVIRGHAHVYTDSGAVACYTFSGDYGMLTRLRWVKRCRVARSARTAPLLPEGDAA